MGIQGILDFPTRSTWESIFESKDLKEFEWSADDLDSVNMDLMRGEEIEHVGLSVKESTIFAVDMLILSSPALIGCM